MKGLSLLLFTNALLLLSGCNTVAGVGKDLQAGGKELQKVSTEHQTTNSNNGSSTSH